MDPRVTKLQWDFLESNIRATKLDYYGERNEIIDRCDIGYLEFQKFLLDYKYLEPMYREQLSLGLPLSSKQEADAYDFLEIEDEDQMLSRKEIIHAMSIEQRTKLNALTPEARQTVVARLVDGRILGVLDQVLDAAPDLFADRIMVGEVAGNKLEQRLIRYFQLDKALTRQERINKHQKNVDELIKMVGYGLVEEVVLVSVASELLTEEQREYWRGHTSGRQKRELARHLLLGSNQPISDIGEVGGKSKDIKAHIRLGLPLTDQQLKKIEELRVR